MNLSILLVILIPRFAPELNPSNGLQNQSMLSMNFYRFFLLVLFSLFFAGCSTASLSGAFGTSAPSGTFEVLPNTVTAEQSRFISGESNPDPRVLDDMKFLASQRSDEVYQIGSADLLAIKVFQAEELSGEVRVDQHGSITLPLLGNVRVAGLTQIQAEKRLANLLGANLLQNPQVSIFIKEFTTQRITVEGEVNRQGVFPLKGKITVLQAIALAGGLGEQAKSDSIALFRKESAGDRVYYIDINLIRNGKVNDPLVKNDDRIVVQRFESQNVTVEGEVNRPGIFNFTEPTTILQTIALSQGLTSLGAPNKVILFRRNEGTEKAYGIDLTAIRQGREKDPFIQAGDRIVVHRSNSRYWLNQATSLLSPLSLISSWVR